LLRARLELVTLAILSSSAAIHTRTWSIGPSRRAEIDRPKAMLTKHQPSLQSP
jgi:hypothetical protein